MSILDNTSKRILVQSMRNVMENAVVENAAHLSESQIVGAAEFVHENATYEQLLNVSLNPSRETKYLPAHVLEGAAAIIHAACMTGRKRIGANALAEGAMNLHESTGAVITESMLDAAYDSVIHGNGLAVIAESLVLSESKASNMIMKELDKSAIVKPDGTIEFPLKARVKAMKQLRKIGWDDERIKKSLEGSYFQGHGAAQARKALAKETLRANRGKKMSEFKAKKLKGYIKDADDMVAAKTPFYKSKLGKGLGIGAAGLAAAGGIAYGIHKWRNRKKKEEQE